MLKRNQLQSRRRRSSRHRRRYEFIPITLAEARIHRVLAVLRGRVFVEFANGQLRCQVWLRVPDSDLADFLADCAAQGALKEVLLRPAFISHTVPQAHVIRRRLETGRQLDHNNLLP